MDIKSVAGLMQLRLTADEEAVFTEQLTRILDHATQLQRVDIDGVDQTVTPNPAFNVVRDDTPQPSLDRDVALSLAPQQANHLVIVPKVFD